MTDKLEITVVVAGHPLSMTIDPDERESLELAADEIDVVWSAWSKKFKGRQKSEILAMVALLFAQRSVALREENERVEGVLADFEQRLDDILMLNVDDSAGVKAPK